MRLCDDRVLAEDIEQESYLKFLEKPPVKTDFRARKSYLYTIASRLVADYFRDKKKKEAETEMAERLNTDSKEQTRYTDPAVRNVLHELGNQDQSLLWLAYVEGYSHQEIGKVIGVKPKSVRVLLYRARQRFRGLIGTIKKADHGTK